MLPKKKFLQFINALKEYELIYILGHIRPDADCIAAQLGMQQLCTTLGLRAFCWNEGPFNRSESKAFKSSFSSLSELPRDSKKAALCLADCSEIARAGAVPLWLANLPIFIVDHHASVFVSREDPQVLCDPDTPAAAALVCELYRAAETPLNAETANLLFMGIASDTYFFRYTEAHQNDVFLSAQYLLVCGASPRTVADTLETKTSLPSMHMIGTLLSRARPIEGTPFLVTTMTLEEKQACGGIESQLLYENLLHVASCRALVFLWEETQSTIVGNLRSKAPLSILAIATHFGGGGHKQAAGFRRKDTRLTVILHEVEDYIKNI